MDLLSFTEASLIAPLTLLVLLSLPTIIYVSHSSIKFYGWNSWTNSILDDPIHFIFPIFTSISFYKKRNQVSQIFEREIEKEETKMNSSNSVEDKEEVFENLQVLLSMRALRDKYILTFYSWRISSISLMKFLKKNLKHQGLI